MEAVSGNDIENEAKHVLQRRRNARSMGIILPTTHRKKRDRYKLCGYRKKKEKQHREKK
jgi:hypothetical protein